MLKWLEGKKKVVSLFWDIMNLRSGTWRWNTPLCSLVHWLGFSETRLKQPEPHLYSKLIKCNQ